MQHPVNPQRPAVAGDSQVCALLRFPLAVAVVFIHFPGLPVGEAAPGAAVYDGLRCGMALLTPVAISLFFFMSGYLFFLNAPRLTWGEWRAKLRRRAGTLLWPYLTWITLFLLLSAVGVALKAGFGRAAVEGLQTWAETYLTPHAYFDFRHVERPVNVFGFTCPGNDTPPALGPMWFVRDLILLGLLAPIVHRGCRWLSWLFPGLLWLAFATGFWWNVPGMEREAWFYFSLGACFSVRGASFSSALGGWRTRILLTALYLSLFALCVVTRGTVAGTSIDPVFDTVQALTVLSWAAWNVRRPQSPARQRRTERAIRLGGASFVVYAAHPFLLPLGGLLARVLPLGASGPATVCWLAAHYLLTPLLVAGLCVLLWRLLNALRQRWPNRLTRTLHALLAGARHSPGLK